MFGVWIFQMLLKKVKRNLYNKIMLIGMITAAISDLIIAIAIWYIVIEKL